ncbi:hypothetical protein L1080_036435 [Rhodococcus sp. MSC1_016]|jgi:hypothetical protein|uniref:hypothetical protein n=1 Tax=Rhodococcus sp. MSC1_016 TaxID=2909266 RepID=UPI00202EBA57|nr:hypothetical protein [Rhodococcus sp. MSC1_016]
MNLPRTPTHTLYGSVAYGGSMSTLDIKSHIEAMFDSTRPAPDEPAARNPPSPHPTETR